MGCNYFTDEHGILEVEIEEDGSRNTITIETGESNSSVYRCHHDELDGDGEVVDVIRGRCR